jgi:hypothetical protein
MRIENRSLPLAYLPAELRSNNNQRWSRADVTRRHPLGPRLACWRTYGAAKSQGTSTLDSILQQDPRLVKDDTSGQHDLIHQGYKDALVLHCQHDLASLWASAGDPALNDQNSVADDSHNATDPGQKAISTVKQ